MKFAVAVHGTRGDVEPCAAVAVELQRRGHDVGIGVPPDLVEFPETAGLTSVVGYGVSSQSQVDSDLFRDWWKARNPLNTLAKARDYVTAGWDHMSQTLVSLSDGADLILSGSTYQEVALSVAEYRGLPLAALQYFPMRPNSKLSPVALPRPLAEAGMRVGEWGYWRMTKRAEDAQRASLGLRPAITSSARRIVERGTLEIQAYDEALFPGLDEEWGGERPFVGSLTLGLEAATDRAVAAWIEQGTPPIFFGLGSTPVDSPTEFLAMIESVCAELDQRALVSSSGWKTPATPRNDNTLVVTTANYGAVFPQCRAVVHHGGAGTLAAGIRAGVPTLALWSVADQPLWSNRAARLRVGVARKFSKTTRATLLADLRTILAPDYAARARELSTRMVDPATGVRRAADLIEAAARRGQRVVPPV